VVRAELSPSTNFIVVEGVSLLSGAAKLNIT